MRPSQLLRAGIAMYGFVAPDMGTRHQVKVRKCSGVGHQPLWSGPQSGKRKLCTVLVFIADRGNESAGLVVFACTPSRIRGTPVTNLELITFA